jgi:maltose-binding protein MalE
VSRYRQAFPPFPATDLLWKAVDTAISGVLTGAQPPGSALDTAAGQMRQALRQAGYAWEE